MTALTHQSRGDEVDAFDISTFCGRHAISRATLYNLFKAGTGPRTMRVGTRTLISREAAADWRREREAAAEAQRRERAEADEEWRRQREGGAGGVVCLGRGDGCD